MANEENLKKGKATQFKSGAEAARFGKKGGKASGRAKRQKKTVQEILTGLMSTPIKDMPSVQKLAQRLGIGDEQTVKELFTIVCVLKTMEKGRLDDLEMLVRLLGEKTSEGDKGLADKLAEIFGG